MNSIDVKNWKMFEDYKNKMLEMTKDGGLIVISDPTGRTRYFRNVGGVAVEI